MILLNCVGGPAQLVARLNFPPGTVRCPGAYNPPIGRTAKEQDEAAVCRLLLVVPDWLAGQQTPIPSYSGWGWLDLEYIWDAKIRAAVLGAANSHARGTKLFFYEQPRRAAPFTGPTDTLAFHLEHQWIGRCADAVSPNIYPLPGESTADYLARTKIALDAAYLASAPDGAPAVPVIPMLALTLFKSATPLTGDYVDVALAELARRAITMLALWDYVGNDADVARANGTLAMVGGRLAAVAGKGTVGA